MEEPILVTGANGFIGRRLVEQLLDEGRDTHAFLLKGTALPPEWAGRATVHWGDITAADSLHAAAKSARTIFHLAAVVGDWGAEQLFQSITVTGTRNVLDAARHKQAKVILASSIAVYGHQLGNLPCSESLAHGRPQGPYGRSKQAQEVLAQQYAAAHQLPIVIIRPANVYGPACRPWLHDLIDALHQGPAIIGHGNLNAGLVYVDNLVGLMIRAAEAPHAVGHTYNAAEDCPITWRQYVTDIARLAKAPPPRSIPLWAARPAAHLMEAAGKLLRRRQRPQLTREALQLVGSHLDIPIHKARAELNYQPRVSYEQGLAQVAEYWKRLEQAF
jgi:2-alkyl-3-oxoalkanoate reductase